MRKMNALNSLTLAALLAAGVSTVALAQQEPAAPPPPPPGEDMAMQFFDKVDTDKDGKITQAEIDAFKAARFAEADTDKDGKLSPAELVAMREKMEAERRLTRAEKMVSRFDRDGDGLLTADELAAGPRPKSMLERLDTDGDGAVSKAEAEAAHDRMAERMGKHGKGGEKGRHGKGGHGPMGDGPMDGGPKGGDMMEWWFN